MAYLPGLNPEQFLTCLAIDKNNNTSEFSITRSSTTIASLEDVGKYVKVGVYPNPVSEYFRFDSNELGEIKIFNNQGSLVRTFKLGENANYYVGDLPDGIYLVVPNSVSITDTYNLIILK
ncbi:MAG: T9SS type A sorting domain-containing protein [Bacteroidales bacterium]|nr:T9SS type A sorting domain-containing protein [Bacteroidales bacterium]